MLEEVAVRSITGKFCAPVEAKPCFWSGEEAHPDDLRVCELTGLPIYVAYATEKSGSPRLNPLVLLLDGIKRTSDESHLWDTVATKVSAALGGSRCRVEATLLSPGRKHLAVCSEVRTMLGFRVRNAGFVYSICDNSIIGRVTQSRRTTEGWSEIKR